MNLSLPLREPSRRMFVCCMLLGAAVSRLPFLAEPNGNIAIVPYVSTWFGCGFVAGLLAPDRPWRWGLAMAMGAPIAGVLLNPRMALVALLLIPLIPVVATPIAIGAYLGRLVSPGRMVLPIPPLHSEPSGISSRLFLVFAIGFVASTIPVFLVPQASSTLLIVWILTAATVAATSVAWAKSGILKGTGSAIGMIIAAFMTSVVYDTTTGGPNHHMLPFEMWYVMIVTTVPASLFSLVTHWVVGKGVRRNVA
jgi:hypothetical protein